LDFGLDLGGFRADVRLRRLGRFARGDDSKAKRSENSLEEFFLGDYRSAVWHFLPVSHDQSMPKSRLRHWEFHLGKSASKWAGTLQGLDARDQKVG